MSGETEQAQHLGERMGDICGSDMEEIAVAEATGAAEELDVRDQGTGQANSSPLDAMKMRPAVEWCTPYH